jgi:hypothetical protein
MGVYTEYLDRHLSFEQLAQERKLQLHKISELRNRATIVYASDVSRNCPNNIDYSDLTPFADQLSVLGGDSIDIILETPGGFAEVVEDLVKMVRSKFSKVGIIIPGMAKSAGTIFTMAADEILMSETSSLGPIDAQIMHYGKRFSADALLEGINKIREEAQLKKQLDIAYIPILQNISPGEIQHAENAQNFSRMLVTKWLQEYKFKFWDTHSSTGNPVTEQEKEERANDIAKLLCNHGHWLTHARSIKIDDLQEMRLQITNYSSNTELFDAINRYYTLLRMTFETNTYKIYETATTQIYRFLNPPVPAIPNVGQVISTPMLMDVNCGKCNTVQKIQIDLGSQSPPMPDTIPFPANNIYKCNTCGTETDLSGLRQQIEAQLGKQIV